MQRETEDKLWEVMRLENERLRVEIERLQTENDSLRLTLVELNANRNLRLAE
jgi:hypothetical protein